MTRGRRGLSGSPQPLVAAVQASASGSHAGPLDTRRRWTHRTPRHPTNHFGCFSSKHFARVPADQIDFLANRIREHRLAAIHAVAGTSFRRLSDAVVTGSAEIRLSEVGAGSASWDRHGVSRDAAYEVLVRHSSDSIARCARSLPRSCSSGPIEPRLSRAAGGSVPGGWQRAGCPTPRQPARCPMPRSAHMPVGAV